MCGVCAQEQRQKRWRLQGRSKGGSWETSSKVRNRADNDTADSEEDMLTIFGDVDDKRGQVNNHDLSKCLL